MRRNKGPQVDTRNDDGSVLRATRLAATSVHGPIFGPLDLTLTPGTLCIVHGTSGSGRSALLLALAGRLRRVTGELLVAGYDAAFDTRAVLSLASVGRIGQYAAPDDRLTVGELIGERAVQDGIRLSQAVDRAEEIEDFLGYRIDRGALYEDLPAAEKTMLCAGLAMLRPAAVVVVDEADHDVPAHQVATLFATLQRLATMEDNVVIVSASNANAAPVGAMRVHLAPTKLSRVHKIEEPPVAIDEATEAPEEVEPLDPDLEETVVAKVGEEGTEE
ncbi:ATP-binding cassette domain-containing protein [Trueperella abortisuis]|uniref:ATP-binding cassette domain-containing protein n=1 Tax=Trueperella abortisuis TaxID=445930 RepID=UPI002892A058|nr:ATP-binding cassette domain-containing protein [Trueperella abortisuis]